MDEYLKVFESKDVEDADGLEVVFPSDAIVELADDPVETLGIKCHGHGVSRVHRLQEKERGEKKKALFRRTVHDSFLYLFVFICK